MCEEIALYRGYGGEAYPEGIRSEIEGKSFIEKRVKILPKYIKTLESIAGKKLENAIFGMKDGDVVRHENAIVIAADDGFGNLVRYTCEIVRVDTSKKWTVEEYDGSEYIEYLDYELVNKELNYWEKK